MKKTIATIQLLVRLRPVLDAWRANAPFNPITRPLSAAQKYYCYIAGD
jgi:hypothetical protein